MDALPPHHRELGRPEVVPARVVLAIRDARVETGLLELPRPAGADSLGQGADVVVGVGVAKGFPRGVEQVLAVDEDDGSLCHGLLAARISPGKNNPARGLSAYRAGGKCEASIASSAS